MEMSFIGDCVRHHEAAKAVATEWQYVAIVLDRLLLWVSPQGVRIFSKNFRFSFWLHSLAQFSSF
jgi:hypothetical protein